ncbi:hypothetical protein [Alcaligenes sp. WGS1538]
MQKLINVILGLLAHFFRPKKAEEAGPPTADPKPLRRLAWGNKVSAAFRD